jgi:prophage maintenance system killer protein
VLLFTLARSQACPDGNKRAAVILTEAFVAINGHTLETSNDELESEVRSAAECEATDREAILARLADWFGRALVPLAGEAS